MVRVSSVERDVDVFLDEDGNAAVATIVEERELRLEELFVDGELRLWEGSEGWSGFKRVETDGGTRYYRVNTLHDEEPSWTDEHVIGEDSVRNGIREHIEDPEAGGAGNFRRRCSPP